MLSLKSSTSSRVVGGPDIVVGDSSSKGGRGLGGSGIRVEVGVEKRIRYLGVSVSDSGDSRSASSVPSSGGVRSICTRLRGSNVGLPIARKSICLEVSSGED